MYPCPIFTCARAILWMQCASGNCTCWEARCTYDGDVSDVTGVAFKTQRSHLLSGLMYTSFPLCPRYATVIQYKSCFERFLFVLNWQFLFNSFGVWTHCLYKLLWHCYCILNGIWMGCVDWIIKVVHFLKSPFMPLFIFSQDLIHRCAWNSSLLSHDGHCNNLKTSWNAYIIQL